MTVNEIKTILKTPEYEFLKTNPHLGNNIILLGLGGSHAYGTNVEGSDVDIRGIALNSKSDILGSSNFEQVVNEATDTTIYSFRKILSLLSSCNPNTIEIFKQLNGNKHLIKGNHAGRLLKNAELRSLFV